MQISIRSPAASPVRFRGKRLQTGLYGQHAGGGFSPFLNWLRVSDLVLVKTDNSWTYYNAASVAAGYFTADGNLSATAPTDASYIEIAFYNPSNNPGQSMANETFTCFYTGVVSSITNLSLTNVVHDAANKKITFKLSADSSARIRLFIDPANRSTPPTNIRIIQDRYLTVDTVLDGITYPCWNNGGEFNPHWLHQIRKFQTLRFMDMMGTNWSSIVNFSDFNTDATVTWGSGQAPQYGISLGAICRIAQQTGCDVHVNFPHQATDACVTSMAAFFRDNFPTSQKVIFEYSNEVWNNGFQNSGGKSGQWTYARANAASKGLPASNENQYTGYRAAECMKIVRDTLNNRARWKGCLATQSVNSGVTNGMIAGFNAWKVATASSLNLSDLFDELAVTAYFGNTVGSALVTAITKGISTVLTVAEFSQGPWLVIGDEIIVGLRKSGTGMPEIQGKYGTVTAISGDNITVNIDSSAYSTWVNDGETFVAPAPYWRLMDESKRLFDTNPTAYPTKFTYFRPQFAQLCRTGVCDFGITMNNSFVLDYMDKKNAANGSVDPANSYWGKQKAIADANGLTLTQYEGGCHFCGSTMVTGQPGQNPVGDKLSEYIVDFGHSPEAAAVYSDSFRRFYAIGGKYPSKFVEAGTTSRFGAWAGIRYFPTAATAANGDIDNPVWKATLAANAAHFAP